MSNFEMPPHGLPDHGPNIDVPVPAYLDEEWCAEFNSAFSGRGIRALVGSYEYMASTWPKNCAWYPKHNRQTVLEVPNRYFEHGALFDGELIGARLVPLDDSNEYITHIALRDAIEISSDWRPVPAYEEIWVPFEFDVNGERLYLYQPPNS